MEYPFDDDNMTYNYSSHRYVPTLKGVENACGINLELVLNTSAYSNPTIAVQRTLEDVSDEVYEFIYENVQDVNWFEYLMAKLGSLRKRIFDMLIAQLRYDLENARIATFSGINVAKGTVIDLFKLRGRAKIANKVEQLAGRPIEGLNYCLLYTGRTPCLRKDVLHSDY